MPDLDIFLSDEELEQASQLVVPVCTIDAAGCDIERLLVERDAFAASLVDGMLVQRMLLRTQIGLRLLAPGDIVVRDTDGDSDSGMHSGVPESSTYEVIGEARLVLFDDHLLLAAHRCPRLLSALLLHLGQQTRRVTSQMMICQLPRVEDRVLAMMWLLADTWGRVTPAGTFLGLRLTHQSLGELVGARRPTVTLALKQLTDRGALRRHQRGWLLLERPARHEAAATPAFIRPSDRQVLATPVRPAVEARLVKVAGSRTARTPAVGAAIAAGERAARQIHA